MNNKLNRDVWAEVNLSAITHNLKNIRQHIDKSVKLCAVVKANAYGHGAVAVARCAVEAGADYLAVATLDEALELRAAGFTQPILILGLVPATAANEIVANDITQAVADFDLARAICQAAVSQNKTAKVHLKVETGMGRIGASPEEAVELATSISLMPNVELEGIFSHFAAADTKDKTFVNEQLALFNKTIDEIKKRGVEIKIRHIAESAAILEIPEAHFDMVRSGIITYGLYPSDEVTRPIEIKQAMRLVSRVAFIKKIKAGTSIGYGRDFITERDSVIATMPLGYADGYIRAYKGFYVEINGQRAPIAGRVCMDQVMIDVTDIENIKVGDEVTLFGSDTLTIDDAANHLKTINYEVTCLVSSRVPRFYIN
ncbi:MAG: alanine racemase [Selenomonadaceae bacterium]|nr:alanine racemase [Selenomonadaceae bacterium]